jgi:hypothetical protein
MGSMLRHILESTFPAASETHTQKKMCKEKNASLIENFQICGRLVSNLCFSRTRNMLFVCKYMLFK